MSKIHARFGSASNLYRTDQCPGWILFSKDEPKGVESIHALRGTCFHDKMEILAPLKLEGKLEETVLKKTLAAIPEEFEDLEEYIEPTLDKVQEAYDRFCSKHDNVTVHFEVKVKYSNVIPNDCFGTSDVVFTGQHKKTQKWSVVCIDYKAGKGVPVSAEENLQGIAYGLGAVNSLPHLKGMSIGICMVMIAQICLDPEWLDNPKARFTFEGDEIRMYQKKIEEIVLKAKAIYYGKLSLEENLHAGSHCRFCPMDGKCPEQKKSTFDLITQEVKELPIEENGEKVLELVKSLTLDQQVEVFLKKSQIEDFLNAVASNLTSALKAGVSHDDVKLVQVKGRRGWDKSRDEDELVMILKKCGVKDPYKKKVIGITDAKKLAKKSIDHLIVEGEGRLELVPAGHRGAAVRIDGLKELPE